MLQHIPQSSLTAVHAGVQGLPLGWAACFLTHSTAGEPGQPFVQGEGSGHFWTLLSPAVCRQHLQS